MTAKNFDIIIDDGKVLVKEYVITKSMPLTSFAKQLVQVEKSMETPMLPNNCVKFKSNGKTNEYFIHIPMGSYQIRYKSKVYLVTFPHQIIYFKFKTTNPNDLSKEAPKMLWCFEKDLDFTKKQFQKPAMHNMHSDNTFCMGTVKRASTQVEYMNNFLMAYFENQFNDDLSSGKRNIVVVSKDQEANYDPNDKDIDEKLAKLWLVDVNIDYIQKHTFSSLITSVEGW